MSDTIGNKAKWLCRRLCEQYLSNWASSIHVALHASIANMWPSIPNSLKFGVQKSNSNGEPAPVVATRSVANAAAFVSAVQSSLRSHDAFASPRFNHSFSPVLSCLPSAPLSARLALAHTIASACSELCPTTAHHAWCRGWLPYLSCALLCLPAEHSPSVLATLGPMQPLEAPYPPKEARRVTRPMSALFAAATACGEAGEADRCAWLSGLPPSVHVRTVCIRDLVTLHMLLGIYDARVRTMLRGTCHILGISWAEVGASEDALCEWLAGIQGEGGKPAQDVAKGAVAPPFPKLAWPGQDTGASTSDVDTPSLIPATPPPSGGLGAGKDGAALIASGQGGAKGSPGTEAAMRMAKIAAGTVIGAGLMAVTGGLAAAPLLGAAAGVVAGVGSGGMVATAMLSALTFLQAGTGLGILVGIFGATGAGLGSYRMSRRLADISEFRFESLSHEASLSEAGRAALALQRQAMAGAGGGPAGEGRQHSTSPGYHVLLTITGLVVSRNGDEAHHESGGGEASGQASGATPAQAQTAPVTSTFSFSFPTFPGRMFSGSGSGGAASAPTPPPTPYARLFDFIRPWGDWTCADITLASALEEAGHRCGAALGEGSEEESAAVRAQARQEAQALLELQRLQAKEKEEEQEEHTQGSGAAVDATVQPSSSPGEADALADRLSRAGWCGGSLVTYGGLVHLVPVWRVSGGRARVEEGMTACPGGRLYARAFACLPWIGCSEGGLLPSAWMEAGGVEGDEVLPHYTPTRGWLLLLTVPASRALARGAGEEGAKEERVTVGWIGVGPLCAPADDSHKARVEVRVVLFHPSTHGGRMWCRDALLSAMRGLTREGVGERVEWVFRPPVVLGHGCDDAVERGRSRRAPMGEEGDSPGDDYADEEEVHEDEEEVQEGVEEAGRAAQRGGAGHDIPVSLDASALGSAVVDEESLSFASAASAALLSALACGYQVAGRVPSHAYTGGIGHNGHVYMSLLQGDIAYARAVGALQAQLASVPTAVTEAAVASSPPPPQASTLTAAASTQSLLFSLPSLPTVNAAHLHRMLTKLAVISSGAIESKRGWLRKAQGHGEIVSLVWEPDLLAELGDYITQYVQQYLASVVQGRLVTGALALTLLAPLVAATEGFQRVSDVLSMYIDALWQRVRIKAGKCGRVLARVLLDPAHGARPTSLVAWGQGARLAYKALQELGAKAQEQQGKAVKAARAARQKAGLPSVAHSFEPEHASEEDVAAAAAAGAPFPWAFTPPAHPGQGNGAGRASEKSPYGIIQDAILLGTPVGADPESWYRVRPYVCGRFVNGYCTSDFMLRVVYRLHQLKWEAAGLRPIGVPSHADVYSALAKELALPDATPVLKSLQAAVPPVPLPPLPSLSKATQAAWKAAGYAEDGDAPAETYAAVGPAPGSGESPLPKGPGRSSLPPCAATAEVWRGITSVDLTPIVQGHLEYRNKLASALAYVGLDAAL